MSKNAAHWWRDLRVRLHFLGSKRLDDGQWPIALKLAEERVMSPQDAADIVHAARQAQL